MTSPLANGLFARAISQSGLGRFDQLQLPFWPLEEAERLGVAFASSHGIEGNGVEALDALRSLPAAEVLDGLSISALFHPSNTFGGPVADGVVVPEHFEHRYAAGEAAPVPLIIGATSADGFFQGGTLEQIYAPFGELSAKAREIYDPAGNTDTRRIGTLVDADLLFLEPARHIARLHSAAGHPVYLYRFSYVAESLRDTSVGAPHFSDVPFVFGTLDAWVKEPTANDRRVAGEMQAYWLAFARSGVPAPAELPAWPAFTGDPAAILDFRPVGPTVGPDPARERLDLAEELSELRREK
jgi:para-nitrobenzyl esterase